MTPLFIDLVESALSGDSQTAVAAHQAVAPLARRLRDFYVHHGQRAYKERPGVVRHPKPTSNRAGGKRRGHRIEPFESWVYPRDGYTCQYCGHPIVHRRVFEYLHRAFYEFSGTIPHASFPIGHGNFVRDPLVIVFRANVDHVTPFSSSHCNCADNLVASCWSCNYGKRGYTVEELGIATPKPGARTWDGSWTQVAQSWASRLGPQARPAPEGRCLHCASLN